MGRPGRAATAVAEVAVAAMSAPPVVNAMHVTLDCLREVMAADTAGFYIHERTGQTTALYLTPAEIWQLVPFKTMPTSLAVRVHPGVRHLLRQATLQPFTLTDVVTQREWLSSELGAAMRAGWGYNFQLAIPVPAARRSVAEWTWVVGRHLREFLPPDREVAHAVQPVLAVVARHHAMVRGLDPGAAAIATTLTQRELVVLALLIDGVTPAAAAHRLAISPRTVHKHVERIYRKLGAHDRYSAVAAAAELGLTRRHVSPSWEEAMA